VHPLPTDTTARFQRTLELVQDRTKRSIFDTWFKNLEIVEVQDDVARIGTPNQFVKRWIEESDLLHTLCEALRDGFERSLTPELVILRRGAEGSGEGGEESEDEDEPLPLAASAGTFTQAPALEVPPASSTIRGQLEQDSSIQLKDGYSFESYIVGPNNRLAHAAALAVAESPGQAYNPLFVHSAVGLGEDFVNRFIEAVKDGELEQFRYKYRNVDVLVIDDIHFLADKERIQEEFFHTFNTLYNSQRQIILSADCAPSEIPTLEDRLVSRFKWGLVTRIDPPEFETRAAIIKQKAEAKGTRLDDDVVRLLASRIDSNIREIEGAINRLVGTASLMNRRIDLGFATQILSDLLGGDSSRVQIQDICEAVVNRLRVKLSDMQSKKRTKRIAFPRQVCMFLARDMTDLTLSDIGAHFGGRDHTTVIYGIERIEDRVKTEPDLAQLVEDLKRDARALRGQAPQR
jgi:chromosomal replication initiator protein